MQRNVDLDLPQAIHEVYESSRARQLSVARLQRPHRGGLTVDDRKPMSPKSQKRAHHQNTRGIDVFLTLLRQLGTLGLYTHLNEMGLTKAENAMLDIASRDLGNSKDPADPWHERREPGAALPPWSGKETLVDFIKSSFISTASESITSFRPSEVPDFIRIRYTPQSAPYRPFADMRLFRVDLICILVSGELVKPMKREADYNACAVVRLADDRGNEDDVRTYWKDDHEIVPSEVGVIKAKDHEASLPWWTVASQGTFDLYYYRLRRPDNWQDRGSGIDESAPEFEERAWVTELRARESNETPLSLPAQSSLLPPASSATSAEAEQPSSAKVKLAEGAMHPAASEGTSTSSASLRVRGIASSNDSEARPAGSRRYTKPKERPDIFDLQSQETESGE
ncbi:hypothetical protein BGZ57DRAFT_987360 [Hyaloscypha finlandica]|nr:hypothetical protein BGZ57DRAFT_987360 [Hyaloscypha finlandica]